MSDTVLLDFRDERGRFFTKVKLPQDVYDALLLFASLQGITFEEVVHQAIEEHAKDRLP